jgi:hypothetical protein
MSIVSSPKAIPELFKEVIKKYSVSYEHLTGVSEALEGMPSSIMLMQGQNSFPGSFALAHI